ncbi:MAG: NAD(P)-dependent oxidoreductase, partial [Acidobacteria bacterium]|nr:NAD(P)-dependent oxidoreductase [Acidobacteriota bacterium]
GAGGLIGAALARHFSTRGEAVPLLHRDLDIADPQQVRKTVGSIAPDLIVNCAAVGVDECERDPQLATALNVAGPSLLARAASGVGAAIIHFSTNYVFSGERTDGGFYLPDDVPEPINTYGRTKLEGERLVREKCSDSWVIRTSWVFGHGKESFLATLPQKLMAGEQVVAITDIFASVTYVEDLVTRLDHLIRVGDHGIHHITNDGVCSYAEFAAETASILGLARSERNDLIENRPADALTRPAPRPRWTPMRPAISASTGLPPMRSWQKALASYVATC